jgi:hypothetical protein
VQQIAAMPAFVTGVGTRTGADAGGLLVFDLDGDTAIAWCRARGCDPSAAPTWQVHRSDTGDRLKVLWRVDRDLSPLLGGGSIRTKVTTAAAADTVRGKGEAVELFFGIGQVLLLGAHPDGGHYAWPDGCGPEALAEIPPDWWGLALAVAEGGVGPSAINRPTGASAAGAGRRDWHRLRRCPVCGRNTSIVCSQHRDGRTIRCYRGSTLAPPAGLNPGDVLPGGWAFARDQAVGWGDFAVFVQEQPQKRQVRSRRMGHAGRVTRG